MPQIINFTSTKEMDIAIIPNVIYDDTISRRKLKIEDYFILHPKLLFSFVGYNGKLKLANQLAYDKKCGCFYNIPWITNYQVENNFKELTLSFSQQVEEYRYMIQNWTPSPNISNMQWLSQIALTMILDIKQFSYYTQNNLETCSIFQKKYYIDNFTSKKQFINYINNLYNV